MEVKKRNINIDLVKVVAVFSVISVHFFLNNGFYNEIIIGKKMYLFSAVRTLFMICVPLFLITTGYLMKNKTLSKKYYFGLKRVLFTYILITILIIIYNRFYNNDFYTFKSSIKEILQFDVGYCWYIKMYIGLFLLIPFLNITYNSLNSKKHKIVLICTLIILTSIQGIINIFHRIIPDWWLGIYPITYYFIGCYLREYKVNISKKINIILLIISIIISSGINIYLSYGKTFSWGIHNDYGSILNVIPATLVFIFIINLNIEKVNLKIKRVIVKISELSLGIYLSSAMIDNFLYTHFFKDYNLLSIKGYFKVIPLVFVLSTSISIIVNWLYIVICRLISSITKEYKKIFKRA